MAKEFKDLTFEDRKYIMERYHSGDIYKKEQAVSQMLAALDDYIYYMIHRRFAGYKGIIEDLAQSGRMAIIEHMGDYNPEYKLTTFFSFHIQNALQDVVNRENGESHYYAESKNIIVKTMRNLGMDFDHIDEQVLAMHLNMTTGRLHSILEKTLNKKKVELIEEDSATTIADNFDNPETALMKAEKQKEYRACIEQLDVEEQIVLCMHFGFYYPVFNEEERTYKLTEIQKILDNAGYDINAINEYRSARRHIADIMYKAGLVNKRNQYQSAKEDIGLKFNDADTTNELFDALNSLDGLDGDF
jgi:RNA polymerase sigma factor (sigma-70 family)